MEHAAFRPWPAVHGKRGDALAAGAGAALTLAFAPYGYYLLAPLALAVFFVLLNGQRPGRAARRGYLFGVGLFLAGVYWVHISIHVFGGAALGLALALMLLLVLFLSLYPAVFAWFVNRFFPGASPWRWLLVMPAAWTLLEWLRGWLLTGFPWLSLGYSQSDSALRGLVPVLGVFGASWAVALTAGALAAVLASRGWAGRTRAVLPVLVVWAGAGFLHMHDWTRDEGEPVTVSLVQGSVPQEIKWLPEQLQPTVELYVGLTEPHLTSDLIVWPEAAIPTARHNLEGLFRALQRRGAETETDFLIGAVEVERDSGRRLNTVVAIPRERENFDAYVKRHLVPFGEYYPVPGFVREWIRWMDLPYSDFSSGEDDQPPLEVAGQRVGISICYEDVFGEELVGVLPESDLLINVSNDAWFGGSVAPHQHLQIARLRAIEAGRTLMRATNNGISAAIGPDGAVYARSPQFEPYVLTWPAQPRSGATPYSRWTNWPAVLLALAAVAGAWRFRRDAALD